MLEFRGVDTHYGDLHVLKAVDYRIDAGEIVCLLGGNASGKSTTMKAIMGIVRPSRGEIVYEGQSLNGVSTAERVRRGIAPVLEARRLFPRMTVYENLEWAPTRARAEANSPPISNASSRSFHASRSGCASSPAPCRAASSRWLRSAGR
jgi:branched-chain amino acid transport system ATP-binding protein